MIHGSTSTPPAAPGRYRNPAEALIGAKAARLIRLGGLPVKLTYGPKDVARILDIGWRTIYTMMQDGRLPSAGRPARIPVEALAPILDPPQATIPARSPDVDPPVNSRRGVGARAESAGVQTSGQTESV